MGYSIGDIGLCVELGFFARSVGAQEGVTGWTGGCVALLLAARLQAFGPFGAMFGGVIGFVGLDRLDMLDRGAGLVGLVGWVGLGEWGAELTG